MKKIRLQAILVATLLFVGGQFALAETVEVNVGGINYTLDSESMTATVETTAGVSGDIVLPESVSYGDKNYVLKSIGDEAFVECKDITSMKIPSSVTSIGVHAFYGCI